MYGSRASMISLLEGDILPLLDRTGWALVQTQCLVS